MLQLVGVFRSVGFLKYRVVLDPENPIWLLSCKIPRSLSFTISFYLLFQHYSFILILQ